MFHSCQVHFDKNQYECGRADKKLKASAVPTIFQHSNPPKQPPQRRQLKRQQPVCDYFKAAKKPAPAAAVTARVARDHTYDSSCKNVNQQAKNITKQRSDHSYSSACLPVDGTPPPAVNSDPHAETQSSTTTVDDCGSTLQHEKTVQSSHTEALVIKLRNKVRKLQRENIALKSKVNRLTKTCQKFLKPDQILHLQGGRFGKWSSDTVRTALKIRTATGKNGYEFLRKDIGYPLPSYRTLCERVESLQMQTGIQTEILQLLQLKTNAMLPREKDCVLILDEVQLKRKIEYDTALKQLTGYVSPELGRDTEEASHAMVFMIKGLCKPFKQVVAWYLTGMGTRGSQLWSVTLAVIKQLHQISLTVRVVTSDMGSANVGMWKAAGLDIHQNQNQCSVKHPCVDNMLLYFMADVPHLLKNMRNCLEKHHIAIPKEIVNSHKLPSSHAEMTHIEAVVKLQETSELRLAPGLSEKVVHPGQYGKMKVNSATKIFSHSTAVALTSLAESGSIDANAATTAWLCETFNKWFDIMSNRVFKAALFMHGKKISTLEEMICLVRELKVGSQCAALKPWQKGMMLSTNTVIALHQELVKDGDYTFLLTCRLTQDCLENLFSQIRGLGDSHPSAVRFRLCLKHISISQLLNVPKSSSYDVDNLPNLVDFIKRTPADKSSTFVQDSMTVQHAVGVRSNYEEQSLYYLTGWVAHKYLQQAKPACPECEELLTVKTPILPAADFTIMKSYGGLRHPSEPLFRLITKAEDVFMASEFRSTSVEHLVSKLLHSGTSFTNCSKHSSVKDKILKRYFKLRMHIHANFVTEQLSKKKQHASKSAVARTTIT